MQAARTPSCCGRRAHSDGLRFFVRITRIDTGEVPLKPDSLCDDKGGVYAVRSKRADAREDERGFTLPGLLTIIAILGLLITIAVLALDRAGQEEGLHYYLIRLADPYGTGGPRPAVSGQVNGRTQTLATQVALRNLMR
jgi:hypothetical protein